MNKDPRRCFQDSVGDERAVMRGDERQVGGQVAAGLRRDSGGG
jgi:hypothetical protein